MNYVIGTVVLMLVLVAAFAIGACVVAGWADKETERLMDIEKEGVCNECKKLLKAAEEAGEDDF